jgi:hypothetical protein
MAKASGLGDNFYIGGYDVSGDVASVDTISGGPEVIEVTGIKQLAHARIGGLRPGAWSFTSYFNQVVTAAAPGVPASLTPVVSTYNNPVFVTITGGTMTNVSINGVTVGTGAGTYVLPALGTIVMTYTVAPTWNWVAVPAEHQALSGLTRSDLVATYFHGTTIGNDAANMTSKLLNYDPTRDTSGNLTLKIDLQANGFGYEWGKMLTPGLRTDTTATTSTFFDQGAAGTFGGQAYLQLVELVGTNIDVTITHATTSGGSYTTLADFGSQTGIGAFRIPVNGTVNEFLKVASAGTFSYAQFAVSFSKNPVAVSF